MTLTDTERDYLAASQHGRLATVAANGAPQNKPVGFRYNPGLGTIDICGFNMEASAKFRNILACPDVAFLVDDVTSATAGAAGVRFLEIRGRAEAVTLPDPPASGLSTQIIRIHPRRVIGWNVDPERPGLHARNIADRPR